MKKNSKGFVLVETLVVSVFVATIFIMIYMNVIPILAKYEVRKRYDDMDSKYAANYIRNLIIDDSNYQNLMNVNTSYKEIHCTDFSNSSLCNEMISALNVDEMYITYYTTTSVKGASISNKTLKDYVKAMPSISANNPAYSTYNAKRLIIRRSINDLTYFANIEIVKK